jgi:hypothetical protein
MTALSVGQLLIVFHNARDDKEILGSRLDCGNTGKKEVCKRVTDNANPEFIDDPRGREQIENRLHAVAMFRREVDPSKRGRHSNLIGS